MHIIGLTGGIGSGKSTVSAWFREHGATIVDADLIARDIVEPGQPALRELGEAFEGVIDTDGTLNRAELARQAFASPEATARLNEITHPRIHERVAEQFQAAREDQASVAVYDMPLLIENDQTGLVDTVLVVDAPDELRVARVVDQRGLNEDDVRRRISAQLDRDTRCAAADVVIDNSGDMASLIEQIEAFWDGLKF